MPTAVRIVSKDVYNSTVTELENRAIEINTDEVKLLIINLVKNIKNFNELFEMLESALDFVRDVKPIANEVIIDFENSR